MARLTAVTAAHIDITVVHTCRRTKRTSVNQWHQRHQRQMCPMLVIFTSTRSIPQSCNQQPKCMTTKDRL